MPSSTKYLIVLYSIISPCYANNKRKKQPFANLNKGFKGQTPRKFSDLILAPAKKTN